MRDAPSAGVSIGAPAQDYIGARASSYGVHWRRQVPSIRRSLREHSLLIALIALETAAGFWLPGWLGLNYPMQLPLGGVLALIGGMVLWVGPLALVVLSIFLMRRQSKHRLLPRIQRILRMKFFRASRIWGGLIILLLLIPFVISTAFFLGMVPIFRPFDFDPLLVRWDRILHFGRDPWEWLQPVLGYPIITSFLSIVYDLWYLVLYGVMIWQAFDRRDPVLRMQYFLSTVLIWVVMQNFLSALFSSVGPAFYGAYTGLPDPFAPLLAYLRSANLSYPVWSLHVQDLSWKVHEIQGAPGDVNNIISAMPSLHLATTFSFFLLACRTGRRLKWVFGVFLALILLGSIHLAWHYAIDSYVGILGAGLIWLATGWLVRHPAAARLLWENRVVRAE